jgi:hypothetical protein
MEDAQGPPELPSDEQLELLCRSPIRNAIWGTAPKSLQEQLAAATARVMRNNGCAAKTCSVTYTNKSGEECCITW